MPTRSYTVIMNGVTGRMGYRQHLVRSLLAIRDDGGVVLPDGDRLTVEPVLVGRNADKLAARSPRHGIADWTTDLDAALADPSAAIYFDAQVTSRAGEGDPARRSTPASTSTPRSRSPRPSPRALELAAAAAAAGRRSTASSTTSSTCPACSS